MAPRRWNIPCVPCSVACSLFLLDSEALDGHYWGPGGEVAVWWSPPLCSCPPQAATPCQGPGGVCLGVRGSLLAEPGLLSYPRLAPALSEPYLLHEWARVRVFCRGRGKPSGGELEAWPFPRRPQWSLHPRAALSVLLPLMRPRTLSPVPPPTTHGSHLPCVWKEEACSG